MILNTRSKSSRETLPLVIIKSCARSRKSCITGTPCERDAPAPRMKATLAIRFFRLSSLVETDGERVYGGHLDHQVGIPFGDLRTPKSRHRTIDFHISQAALIIGMIQ